MDKHPLTRIGDPTCLEQVMIRNIVIAVGSGINQTNLMLMVSGAMENALTMILLSVEENFLNLVIVKILLLRREPTLCTKKGYLMQKLKKYVNRKE